MLQLMETRAAPTEPAIEQQMTKLGRDLAHTFDRVIGHMLESPSSRRPNQLDRVTGVGRNVAYRILKAVRAEDPINVLHELPGIAPLRRLLKAATKRSVSASLVTDAERALGEFEHFVHSEVGDRATLDLLLGGWLPEARRKNELLAKQAAFRAMSQIKGMSTDVLYHCTLLYPSDDGAHLDGIAVRGLEGLRRWRRGAQLRFDTRRIRSPNEACRSLSIDGRPLENAADWMLPDFSTVKAEHLDVQRAPDSEAYTLHSETLGMRSAVNIAFAEMKKECLTRYRSPGVDRKAGTYGHVSLPARLLVLDTILHPDAFPGSEPQLRIYDTSLGGLADMNDPGRDPDLHRLHETIIAMGTGVDGLRVPEVPRYVELLRHVFERVGMDTRTFRAYRCRIEYPLYASQINFGFDRPPQP